MGHFAERHGNQYAQADSTDSPKTSHFKERHLKQIPKTENILQRALKVGKGMAKDVGSSFLPQQYTSGGFMSGLSAGGVGSPIENMASVIPGAAGRASVPDDGENQELAKLGYNVGAGVLSGGFGGRKEIARSGVKTLSRSGKTLSGTGRAIKDIFRPKKVAEEVERGIESAGSRIKSKYSKGFESLKRNYSGKTVSFADELGSPSSLAEKRLFDSVLEELEFQGIDPQNLSLDESKKVLDLLKGKSRIMEKDIGPLNVDQLKSVAGMKSKQVGAFPDIKQIDEPYRAISDYNEVSGTAANLLEGGGNRIVRAGKMQKVKNLDKGLYKRVRNYRRANTVTKFIKNPLVQAAGLFGTGGKLVSEIFKD